MDFQHQLVAFNTLLVKEIRRILRIWPQTLLPPAITMSLYFIIFGKMILPGIFNKGVRRKNNTQNRIYIGSQFIKVLLLQSF